MSASDSDDPSGKITQVLMVLFALVMMLAFLTFTGLDTIFVYSFNQAYGNDTPATLDQYDAVNSIEYENESVMLHLSEDPQLEADGFRGNDVTEIQLTRADGNVSERIEHQTGVQQYEFSVPADADGAYTLTLLNYHPTDPGLFGSPERYDKQSFTFEIRNGEMANLTVPTEAKYY